MKDKDLVALLDYLEREKGLPRETIVKIVEDALEVAARKSISGIGSVSVTIDQQTGKIEIVAEKEIVEVVTHPEEEISIKEARDVDPNCDIGDYIQIELSHEEFGRVSAQTARQVIAQRFRSAERDVIYEEYRHRLKELMSGTVKKVINGATVIVDLGKVDAILPRRFYPKNETYQVGDRVVVLLWEVKDADDGGADIILSRSHSEMVSALFAIEVPEIRDGTIKIVRICREAGVCTKLAVTSNDARVDIGACFGTRGTRINNVREVVKERIDVIPYSEDPIQMVHSLLGRIEPKKVIYDEQSDKITIVVSDEDYPLAIGKRGANVRLNSELIGIEIEIKKSSEYQARLIFERKQMRIGDDESLKVDLSEIPGINALIVSAFKDVGLDTPQKIFQESLSAKDLSDKTNLSVNAVEGLLGLLMEKFHRS